MMDRPVQCEVSPVEKRWARRGARSAPASVEGKSTIERPVFFDEPGVEVGKYLAVVMLEAAVAAAEYHVRARSAR